MSIQSAIADIQTRIDRLEAVAERWAPPAGPSYVLARRARDKADGLAYALRLLESHLVRTNVTYVPPENCPRCGLALIAHGATCPEDYDPARSDRG